MPERRAVTDTGCVREPRVESLVTLPASLMFWLFKACKEGCRMANEGPVDISVKERNSICTADAGEEYLETKMHENDTSSLIDTYDE